ncbi:MAG: Gfo/Idh/MocA family oxidoreductase [Clostridia bacterium]|nr:Gfo/Idh/MocA family oxidoreductase [Clostridia bacterium]
MEKVRFGIIGLGNQGGSYARNIFGKGRVENGEVTAICDIVPEKMDKLCEDLNWNVAKFVDYKEMVDSGLVDVILVEVPHYLHPEMSIYGLTHGVNVLCEKPAGVYTKAVKEMNAVADKSNKLFGLMFNQRTNCIYRKMRELIAAGEIGEIRRINWIITDWYRTQSYYNSSAWRATWKGEGGGVLMNQCPHQLDLIQWVTGMMPKKVTTFASFGKWHDIEVEDEVTAYLEYENGATGLFVTTTGEACGTNRLEVVGNNGKFVVENDKLIETKLAMGEREFNASFKEGFGWIDRKVFEVETDGKNDQHVGILNNFANAVLGIEPLFVKGQDGINGVELMDAMLLSKFVEKTVTLPIDDDFYYQELQKKVATSNDKIVKEQTFDTAGTYGSKSTK